MEKVPEFDTQSRLASKYQGRHIDRAVCERDGMSPQTRVG